MYEALGLRVVPAGIEVHQAGGRFGVAAGVLVGHQVAELFQCGGAAVSWRPVVVVAVFQEDLAEGAVAQAQGAFAIGVADLHGAAEVIAIEEQVARVGAAHATGFKFPAEAAIRLCFVLVGNIFYLYGAVIIMLGIKSIEKISENMRKNNLNTMRSCVRSKLESRITLENTN